MVKLNNFSIFWIFFLVVTLCLSIQPAGAAEYVMKYGTLSARTPFTKHEVLQSTMKQYIETASDGRIEVQIYHGGQLGNMRQMLEQVSLDTLESCTTSVGGIASFFPEIQVTDLPYHLSDGLVGEMFTQSPFWLDISKAILKKTGNIRFAAAARGGFRNMLMVKGKPIKTIADMKGLKIRTINSDIQQEFIKSLGASATPIAWPEVYTSMQTGVVHGLKVDIPSIITYKLPVYNVFADKHAPLYDFVWVNDKWLKRLPRDLQIVVMEGIRQVARATDQLWKMVLVESVKELKKKGVKFVWPTKEVRGAFVDASREPLRQLFVKKYGDQWLKKFDSGIEATKNGITKDAIDYID